MVRQNIDINNLNGIQWIVFYCYFKILSETSGKFPIKKSTEKGSLEKSFVLRNT